MTLHKDLSAAERSLRQLVCAVVGHRWLTIWPAPAGSSAADSVGCGRCGKAGWRL